MRAATRRLDGEIGLVGWETRRFDRGVPSWNSDEAISTDLKAIVPCWALARLVPARTDRQPAFPLTGPAVRARERTTYV